MSLKQFGQAALLVALAAACGKNRTQVTDNGLKYQMHEHNESAKKAKVGDIMTVHLTLLTSKDSVLRDTHKEGAPFQLLLQVPPFKGSYEEGLAMMGKGDSATFYVPADSLFTKNIQPLPPGVTKGSDIGIAVKVLNVQSEEEFKKQQAVDMEKQKSIDEKTIQDYIAKNGLTGKVQKSPQGVYYVVTQPGTGPKPQRGEVVSVQYVGKLLNGKEFDSSYKNPQSGGKPVQFQVGVGMVIPGWEDGLMQMHKGEKAALIIPSGLAYGPRGAGGTIPPNSVLLFDINLVDIQKAPAGQPGMPQMPPSR